MNLLSIRNVYLPNSLLPSCVCTSSEHEPPTYCALPAETNVLVQNWRDNADTATRRGENILLSKRDKPRDPLDL